jgi:DNA-directed RNA polymerase subunit alpha
MNVGQARKGQETDWDSVLIGVWTDGSISPKESLLESSKILQEFAGKTMIAMGVSKLEVETRETEINTVEESEEVLEDTQDNVDNWKVEDLPISKRSKTALLSGGFKVMADFKEANIDDLLNLAGFGNKSLNEVIELLNQYGINIKK